MSRDGITAPLLNFSNRSAPTTPEMHSITWGGAWFMDCENCCFPSSIFLSSSGGIIPLSLPKLKQVS